MFARIKKKTRGTIGNVGSIGNVGNEGNVGVRGRGSIMLDNGKAPRKEEVEENKASRSARLFSGIVNL